MIVLDTNVISALMRQDPQVVSWLDRQPAASIWTSSVGVFEIEYGLQTLPSGKRRKQLQQAFDQTLKQDLEGRILPLDGPAAQQAAAIAARQKAVGRAVEIRDVLIAGIVASRNAELATGNVKHFAHSGIGLINPWDK